MRISHRRPAPAPVIKREEPHMTEDGGQAQHDQAQHRTNSRHQKNDHQHHQLAPPEERPGGTTSKPQVNEEDDHGTRKKAQITERWRAVYRPCNAMQDGP